MHQAHEPHASSSRSPFQHLLIAVGIPKRENRPPSTNSILPSL
jgi:hypothetical protein